MSEKIETSATALRIPTDLLVWVKQYAKSRNTNVTRLIIEYFTQLRAQHEETHVEQI